LPEKELLILERRKVAWARSHLPKGADSQVGRVVDRFALVALAGELAAEWGVVSLDLIDRLSIATSIVPLWRFSLDPCQ
jgi:hypothetical protein